MGKRSIVRRLRILGAVQHLLRREWSGMALACAILAVHLAGAAHRAFERHVLCSDHGAWVHVEACATAAPCAGDALVHLVEPVAAFDVEPVAAFHAGPLAARDQAHALASAEQDAVDPGCDADAEPRQRPTPAVHGRDGWVGDEHHHCLLVTMARVEGVLPHAPCLTAGLPPGLFGVTALDGEVLHRCVSILHLAPKQSPPAV